MNKGFTLTELLAVIIILSLLTLITATVVTSIVKKGKTDINNKQIILIEKAAELWYLDNKAYLPDDGECTYVLLGRLKSDGFLDDNIYDIEDMELLDDSKKIKVTGSLTSSGELRFTYEFDPSNLAGCTLAG